MCIRDRGLADGLKSWLGNVDTKINLVIHLHDGAPSTHLSAEGAFFLQDKIRLQPPEPTHVHEPIAHPAITAWRHELYTIARRRVSHDPPTAHVHNSRSPIILATSTFRSTICDATKSLLFSDAKDLLHNCQGSRGGSPLLILRTSSR